jgi:hypothetical protein
MPELLTVFEPCSNFGAEASRGEQGEEENGTKQLDPKLYFPSINGYATQAHMDRQTRLSRLGLLRMRLGVQRF